MRDLLGEHIDAFNKKPRYIVSEGGTRSGKTFSILTLLYHISLRQNTGIISVVSETFPHLKKGAIRDFKSILESANTFDSNKWHKTDSIYSTKEHSILEFFSCDNSGKVHGPSRRILFINEAQNISYEVFKQLAVRTTDIIFIDFNPTHEFWAHELKNDPDCIWINSTYLDNPFLTNNQVKEIEKGKSNKYWWDVYGLGKIGRLEGAIFENWGTVDSMPEEKRGLMYGLDFGFTNDPTALTEVCFNNDEIWVNELIYQKGLTNNEIVGLAKEKQIDRQLEIIADCAEPKSIQEIYNYGFNVKPCVKGKDSIINGIQLMQQRKINITKSSTNIIKEFRNYQWSKDKEEKRLNKPIDMWNHSIDSIRYACSHKFLQQEFYCG